MNVRSRLGFSVRIYGRSDLAAYDFTHGRSHWSVGLMRLRDILLYLQDARLSMYRLHGALAPDIMDPESPRVAEQIHESRRELALLAELVRQGDVRLSFHPYSAVVLNALNEDQVLRSQAILEAEAGLLDALELGPEAVVVLHVGGVYDNQDLSRERFIRRYELLPAPVRRRLVLEADDRRFDWSQVRVIHERSGIPLVFDNLHHQVLNPEHVPAREALAYALGTWPAEVTPKIHFSSPRTEMRPLESTGRVKLPTWTEHSDLVNPFEFMAFMRMAEGLRPFDVMLETKARDLAILKLREDLARFAPELAMRLA
jgi:UV DNA damage endonuclease